MREFHVKMLDSAGPLAPFGGTFRDREVELPFVCDPEKPPFRIGVHLQDWGKGPTRGEIQFEPFRIEAWTSANPTWWLAGGAAMAIGLLCGLLFGVYGLIAAIPAFRPAAMLMANVMLWIGWLVFVAAGGQLLSSYIDPFPTGFLPSGIAIPLAVAALLFIIIFTSTRPLVRRAIEEANRVREEQGSRLEPS